MSVALDVSLVQRIGVLCAGDMGSTIVGTYGYMAPEQFTGQVRQLACTRSIMVHTSSSHGAFCVSSSSNNSRHGGRAALCGVYTARMKSLCQLWVQKTCCT